MSPLVIGLVCGLAVGALVIFCCIRSVCKEKTAIERQVKQVHQVDEDPAYDDVEAPTPPSEQNTRRATTTTTASTAAVASATRAPASSTSKAQAASTATKAASPTPAATQAKASVAGKAATATTTTAAKTRAQKPKKPRAKAAHDAPPSYDDLQAKANVGPVEHVYGDDADPFQGVADYQDAGDPYDAPVRVSRSTERRSGSLRSLSPEVESRTSSLSSSRGRAAVRSAAAASAIRATGGGQS